MKIISRAKFERELKQVGRSRINDLIQQSKQTINTIMAKKAKKATSRKSASKKAAPVKVNLIEAAAHLKNLSQEIESEVINFHDNEVKASARRARKSLQEARKLAQAMRLGIQALVNKRKGK